MPFILEYLLKFSISLGVLYMFYQFVLRHLTFYQWNRFYLACYTLLSFLIPFVNITPWINENGNSRLLHVIPVIGDPQLLFADRSEGWWAIILQEKWKFILLILAAGSFVIFLKIAYQYCSLQMIKRKSVLIKTSSVKLYDVNSDISPFSFANSIFINSRLHTAEELQKIMQHEFVHVKQKHTADILIGEMLIIINWFNPFAWLMRKAIRQNLEFIADDNVLQTGLDARQYQYLLLKVVGIPQYSITNNFNFSSLKKRIIMMNKIKTTKVHLVKFLFIVPMLGLLLIAFRQKNAIFRQPGIIKIAPAFVNRSIDDTVPKPPPPPPSLAGSEGKDAIAPTPPLGTKQLPKDVSSITITTKSNASVELKNGTKETYDLSDPKEKANFEKKYGKLVPPPPPPVPPSPEEVVVSETEPVEVNTEVNITEPKVAARAAVTSNVQVKVRTSVNAAPSKVAVKATTPGLDPLVILDGELLDEGTDINTIDPVTIESMNVIKGDQATNLYGNKATNGVIIITSKINNVKKEIKKTENISIKASSISIDKNDKFNGLIIIDGKESTKEALSKLDPASIKQVDILKGDSAISQYKEKGNNGVMIITTK